MGAGGQNRKPNELRRALGNPGRRPLPDESTLVLLPPAAESAPEPPRPLGRHGRDEWDRALVYAASWLAPSDLPMLLLYCETHDEYQRWRIEALETRDWRAQLRVDDCRRQIVTIASELGLSPLGRARLGVAEVRIREGVERLSGGRVADVAEF